jgi:uncharacterized membrane protein
MPTETFCHVCYGARRVEGHETRALQAAVAAWLVDRDTHALPGESYEAQANELLALIARTLREHKPPAADF